VSVMQLPRSTIFSVTAAFSALAAFSTLRAQVASAEQNAPFAGRSSEADAAVLQKKAAQAEARIRANEDDRGALMRAVKTNEVTLAKEVLLRNGFTAKDLEGAEIILRTGGGKGGENEIEISATCCEPREIIIQRTLENFTK